MRSAIAAGVLVFISVGAAIADGPATRPHAAASPSAATPPAATRPTADARQAAAFRADCAAAAAAADKAASMTVPGRHGWLFFASELHHLSVGRFWGDAAANANRYAKPEYADPLPAILDFKARLDKHGIELLIVPVPAKGVVHADDLSDSVSAPVPRLDPDHQAFYALLAARGVHVLDLTEVFLQREQPGPDRLYCQQDTHWSGQGCILAAHEIAAAIAERPWLRTVQRTAYASETRPVEITGDLYAAMKSPPAKKEVLLLRFVGERVDGELRPIDPDPASPIILMGDSHNQVFNVGGQLHARGAGLPDQLALELGFPLDVIAIANSGATATRINLLRNARANPDYLSGKKLLIWCFSVREFTEAAAWQQVPL